MPKTITAAGLGTDTNLVGYWKLDGNGTDSSSGGRDLTAANISYVQGQFDSAASFNGYSSKYTAGSTLNLTGNYSFSLWVNPSALPTSGNIANFICKYYTTTDAGGTPGGYEFGLHNNSGTQNIKINHYATGSPYHPTLSVAHTLTTGVWSHLVGTWNGTVFAIYVNGNLIGSGTNAVANATSNTKLLNIGNFGLLNNSEINRWYNGVMDDVAIFSRALSAAEVIAIYQGGLSVMSII